MALIRSKIFSNKEVKEEWPLLNQPSQKNKKLKMKMTSKLNNSFTTISLTQKSTKNLVKMDLFLQMPHQLHNIYKL